MLGFAPGHPYTARFENPFSFKRRETPRVRIPGGSIVVQLGLSDIIPFDQLRLEHHRDHPHPCLRLPQGEPFLLKAGQWIPPRPGGQGGVYGQYKAAGRAGLLPAQDL